MNLTDPFVQRQWYVAVIKQKLVLYVVGPPILAKPSESGRESDSGALFLDVVATELQVICVINLHYINNECKGRAHREHTNSISKHSEKGGAVIFLAFSTLPNTYHFESL